MCFSSNISDRRESLIFSSYPIIRGLPAREVTRMSELNRNTVETKWLQRGGKTTEAESRQYTECLKWEIMHYLMARFSQIIDSLWSSSLFLEDDVRHDPDAQIIRRGAWYPAVVIEVVNTQRKRGLLKSVDEYILPSSGSTRTVVSTFDYHHYYYPTYWHWLQRESKAQTLEP